jgi:uncharacterized damage-inducible protein DinB
MGAERLDIVSTWSRFNNELIKLVDLVPDDKVNWSPKPELWNFQGTMLHIAATRDAWLEYTVKDNDGAGNSVWTTVRSKEQIKDAYRRTWNRVEAFLSDRAKLDATYDDEDGPVSGHWIAFHLLEHDIHHRADIFHYLALLDIECPGVGTP